ncbi:8500_t:CDS:2 [Entrophospora sp. SA101]|nr:8500_t:CDS:2 [Entrophospora sp. SA101]
MDNVLSFFAVKGVYQRLVKIAKRKFDCNGKHLDANPEDKESEFGSLNDEREK